MHFFTHLQDASDIIHIDDVLAIEESIVSPILGIKGDWFCEKFEKLAWLICFYCRQNRCYVKNDCFPARKSSYAATNYCTFGIENWKSKYHRLQQKIFCSIFSCYQTVAPLIKLKLCFMLLCWLSVAAPPADRCDQTPSQQPTGKAYRFGSPPTTCPKVAQRCCTIWAIIRLPPKVGGAVFPVGTKCCLSRSPFAGVRVSWHSLCGLIAKRNEIAATITAPHSLRQLPPLKRDERSCRRCVQLQVCSMYHRACEGGNANSGGFGDVYWHELVGRFSKDQVSLLQQCCCVVLKTIATAPTWTGGVFRTLGTCLVTWRVWRAATTSRALDSVGCRTRKAWSLLFRHAIEQAPQQQQSTRSSKILVGRSHLL